MLNLLTYFFPNINPSKDLTKDHKDALLILRLLNIPLPVGMIQCHENTFFKDDISHGLNKMYQNKGKYKRKEIQDDSIKRFGNENFVKSTNKIYSNLINEK